MRNHDTTDGTWQLVTGLPDPRLRPGVCGFRGYSLELDCVQRRLEVPNGTVSLVVNFGAPVRLAQAVAERPVWTSYRSLFSGLRTSSTFGEHGGRVCGVEVILTPWMAFRLLGMPMHAIKEIAVPVPEILGTDGRALEEQLTAAADWRARFALLDALLLRRCALGPTPAPQVIAAWTELSRQDGLVPLARLAQDAGWSARHLELRFREQIGLSPKKVARVFRLRRALPLVAARHPGSEIAATCGFYDQAHFNSEFKTMTGCAPSQFAVHRGLTVPVRPVDRLPGRLTSALIPGLLEK